MCARNTCMLKLERESDIMLGGVVQKQRSSSSCRLQNTCIMWGQWEEPEMMLWTTALLLWKKCSRVA